MTLVLSGADISYPNVGLDWATSPRKSVEQFLEVLAAWTVTQPSNPQCRGFALNDSLSGCVANSPSPSLPLLGNSGKYRKGGLQGSLSANGRDRWAGGCHIWPRAAASLLCDILTFTRAGLALAVGLGATQRVPALTRVNSKWQLLSQSREDTFSLKGQSCTYIIAKRGLSFIYYLVMNCSITEGSWQRTISLRNKPFQSSTRADSLS